MMNRREVMVAMAWRRCRQRPPCRPMARMCRAHAARLGLADRQLGCLPPPLEGTARQQQRLAGVQRQERVLDDAERTRQRRRQCGRAAGRHLSRALDSLLRSGHPQNGPSGGWMAAIRRNWIRRCSAASKPNTGTFIGQDTFRGKPVTVRFRWLDMHSKRPNWEQALSPDGGKT